MRSRRPYPGWRSCSSSQNSLKFFPGKISPGKNSGYEKKIKKKIAFIGPQKNDFFLAIFFGHILAKNCRIFLDFPNGLRLEPKIGATEGALSWVEKLQLEPKFAKGFPGQNFPR